ncbi:MAG: DUF1273 family protein [Oscillospiraceae bacterium]|nr:DUF1273 family protein [Oscillospiraceae bacterium]
MDAQTLSAVSFTGHRPEKLPTGNFLHMVQSLLYAEIAEAISQGARTFYTGAARGVDLWAADIVLSFRQKHPELRLVCAVPFPEHGAGLTGAERYHLQTVLHAADERVTVSPAYARDCFRRRNRYLVEHCQRLIAVVADMQSGTGQTIRLAEKQGIDIRLITVGRAAEQLHPSNSFYQF